MLWHKLRFIAALPADLLVKVVRPGGDFDLDALHVTYESGSMGNDAIVVTPYIPLDGEPVEAPFIDQYIVAVEVKNFQSDSRGGCNSANPAVCTAYGQITAILRQQGYNVIAHVDEIS